MLRPGGLCQPLLPRIISVGYPNFQGNFPFLLDNEQEERLHFRQMNDYS